jgi:hypothetical protein
MVREMSIGASASRAVSEILPTDVKRRITRTRLAVRRVTSPIRVLPDFMIIGSGRSGTSSLYKYLGQHPEIVPSLRKEVEYFNRYYQLGDRWYRAHFQTSTRRTLAGLADRQSLAFEATPHYLQDPRTPQRVASMLPEVKLIVLLRNPVARALSCWRHMQRLGFETSSFEEAVRLEPSRTAGEFDRMVQDPDYYSRPYHRFAYLDTGKYATQLRWWFEHFERERFLIIESEEFYSDTGRVYESILEFLGLKSWRPAEFSMYSSATSADPIHAANELPDALRADLESFFAPHNRDLETLLGRRFSWT